MIGMPLTLAAPRGIDGASEGCVACDTEMALRRTLEPDPGDTGVGTEFGLERYAQKRSLCLRCPAVPGRVALKRGFSAVLTFLTITVALLALWQAVIDFAELPRYILPPPLAVFSKMATAHAMLLDEALVTLREILAGFVAGAVFGAAAALFISAFPRLGRFIWPVLVVLQSFPVFVIAPMLVLWFGFGIASKVVMTTIIVFFPVASNFADGLRRTDADVVAAAKLDGAGHFALLRFIRLPLALPQLFSGLRIAAPLAPLGAVVGEWVGSAGGLGFLMVQANARMQTDTVFAAMLILALEAVLFRKVVDLAAPFFTRWSHED